MGADARDAANMQQVAQPAGAHRNPVPIEHTCDRSDISRCACSRARQRERRRERARDRASAARQVREERQAAQWVKEPVPRPRKVLMDPLVHTCDETDRKRCECYRTWMREYQRRRRAGTGRTVDVNRRANLWRLYQVTPEQIEAMRVAQGNRCAICGRHEDEIAQDVGGRPRLDGTRAAKRGLVVDHCHRDGHVRALLCAGCNAGLGHFGDDAARLRAAADWLDGLPDVVR